MRCIACNDSLKRIDYTFKREDGTEEDMCVKCIGASFRKFNYYLDKEWAFGEDPAEGLTEPYGTME